MSALRAVPSDPSAGQPPAHDLDAERAVLSAVLLDGAALARVADFLSPEMFFSDAHRRIFAASLEVRDAGQPVDEQTVASRLREQQRLSQVGGIGYLADVIQASPAVQNVRAHAETVHERWRVRAVQALAWRVAAQGYVAEDAQVYADELAAASSALARRRPGRRVESNLDTLRRMLREIGETMVGEARGEPQRRGMSTGLRDVDEVLLGLHPGQKVTIAAEPGRGKTALGLQLAMHVASSGIGAMYFSTEMSREELGERQLALLSGVDSRRVRQSRTKAVLGIAEVERLHKAVASLLGIRYRLAIHDDASISPEEICSRVRAQHDGSQAVDGVPLGLVVVDYVQRLAPSPRFAQGSKSYDVHGHATRTLKQLAQDLGICVVELAQQKKLSDGKGGKPKPTIGSVAECFTIEREADVVAYLWRPNERDPRTVKLLVVKQRSGDEAEIDLTFEREFSRFRDAEPFYASSPSRHAGTSDEPWER